MLLILKDIIGMNLSSPRVELGVYFFAKKANN